MASKKKVQRKATAASGKAAPAKLANPAKPPKGLTALQKATPQSAATPKLGKKVAATRDAPSSGLHVGDSIPKFTAESANGKVTSASLKGTPFVLYFYPKDDTPGCTRQACGFRDAASSFKASGLQVFGISPDSAESHGRFLSKYNLNFRLLSDSDKSVAMAFGVWVKKKNYGREYMGIERATFLINKAGKVARIWRNVKVDGHVDQVVAAAQAL